MIIFAATLDLREDVFLKRRSGPLAIKISFAIEKNGRVSNGSLSVVTVAEQSQSGF